MFCCCFFSPRNWQWDSYLSLPELVRWPYILIKPLCFASHWVSPLFKTLKGCTSDTLFTHIYSSAVVLSAPSALLFCYMSVLLLPPAGSIVFTSLLPWKLSCLSSMPGLLGPAWSAGISTLSKCCFYPAGFPLAFVVTLWLACFHQL